MTEYRIEWQACPRVHNPRQVLFVNAEDVSGAEAVARDHIECTLGLGWFVIDNVMKYQRPPGTVSTT